MYNANKKYHLGLYEKALPNSLTWEEKLRTAKELGFDFVEISVDETDEKRARLDWNDEEIYHLRHLCEKYQIPLHSMCLSTHRKYPFGSNDSAIREEAYNSMRKAIVLAYKLGVEWIQLAGYDVYYEPQSKETHERFIQGMKDAATMAEAAGIMLGVEIMDTPYLNSLSKFEILKREIPSPYFMAYPDVGNITGWNYDTYTELKLARDHIIQVHLKDTYKVSPTHPEGQFRDLVIGEGEVNFPSIFQALREINYSAPFVIEMWANDENWKENIQLAKKRIFEVANIHGFNFE